MGSRRGDEEIHCRHVVQGVETLDDVLVVDKLFRLFLWGSVRIGRRHRVRTLSGVVGHGDRGAMAGIEGIRRWKPKVRRVAVNQARS